ncbi:pentapeptide repeat-containing protein [uncultured Streptomyces sp.]|uniref:pentapeptide repeat-containing protein n=1 Tax=uncultured Streptomyces sp. TaxID=174707 RepID=UPI00262ADFF8|nr:pentapeptide repeat-containing protein [uncultured Streptomyces sp.]
MATLAVVAFTWISIRQVNSDQAITRQGQIADRYSSAVGNLGEDSQDVRIGGIYALQHIMRDSPGDRTAITNVLSSYVRAHALKPKERGIAWRAPADIESALSVMEDGNRKGELGDAVIDLTYVYLRGAWLEGAYMRGVVLGSANLESARMDGIDLGGSDLSNAIMKGASMPEANLKGADLTMALLGGAFMDGADLRNANLYGAWVNRTRLNGADLRGANLTGLVTKCENFTCTDLSEADLRGADLGGADLRGAVLKGADLRGADLRKDPFAGDIRIDVKMLLQARLDRTTKLPLKLAQNPLVRRALEAEPSSA